MNVAFRAAVVSLVLLSSSGVIYAADVDIDGAKVGRWTMDIDAARDLARQKKLPILLNFTGSDWCGWCKLMDRNVFTKPVWNEYARDNLVTVFIDFPKDGSLVPQKYKARNDKLKDDFGVGGYPTYLVLDDDGETVLSKLGAGREKTAEIFIAEIGAATRYSASGVAKFAETLSPSKRAEYMKIVDQMTEARELLRVEKKRIAEAQQKVKELEARNVELKDAATEFRVGLLGSDKLAEYKQAQSALKAAEQELKTWLATGPQRTPENGKKFQSMNGEIQKLKSKLESF